MSYLVLKKTEMPQRRTLSLNTQHHLLTNHGMFYANSRAHLTRKFNKVNLHQIIRNSLMKALKTQLNILTNKLAEPAVYYAFMFAMFSMLSPVSAEAARYDPIVTFAKDFKTMIIIVGDRSCRFDGIYRRVLDYLAYVRRYESHCNGLLQPCRSNWSRWWWCCSCYPGLFSMGGSVSWKTKTETLKYDTHNAMGRVAMYWGIPVFPLIFLLMG